MFMQKLYIFSKRVAVKLLCILPLQRGDRVRIWVYSRQMFMSKIDRTERITKKFNGDFQLKTL